MMANQCVSTYFRALPIFRKPTDSTELYEPNVYEYLDHITTGFAACKIVVLRSQDECGRSRHEVKAYD